MFSIRKIATTVTLTLSTLVYFIFAQSHTVMMKYQFQFPHHKHYILFTELAPIVMVGMYLLWARYYKRKKMVGRALLWLYVVAWTGFITALCWSKILGLLEKSHITLEQGTIRNAYSSSPVGVDDVLMTCVPFALAIGIGVVLLWFIVVAVGRAFDNLFFVKNSITNKIINLCAVCLLFVAMILVLLSFRHIAIMFDVPFFVIRSDASTF